MSHYSFNVVPPQQTMSHNYGTVQYSTSVSPALKGQQHQHQQEEMMQQSSPSPKPKPFNISSMLNPAPSPPHRHSQIPNSPTLLQPNPINNLNNVVSPQYCILPATGEVKAQYPPMRITLPQTHLLPQHFTPSHSSAYSGFQTSTKPQSYTTSLTITNTISPAPLYNKVNIQNNNRQRYFHSKAFQNTPSIINSTPTDFPNSRISPIITSPTLPHSNISSQHIPLNENSPSPSQIDYQSPTLSKFTQLLPDNHFNIDVVDSVPNSINKNAKSKEEKTINSEKKLISDSLENEYVSQDLRQLIDKPEIEKAGSLSMLCIAADVIERKDPELKLQTDDIVDIQNNNFPSSTPLIKSENEYCIDSFVDTKSSPLIVPHHSYELDAPSSPAQSNTSADGLYEYEEPLKDEVTSESDIELDHPTMINQEIVQDSKISTPERNPVLRIKGIKKAIIKQEISSGEEKIPRPRYSNPLKPKNTKTRKLIVLSRKTVKKPTARTFQTPKKTLKRQSSSSLPGSRDDLNSKSDTIHPGAKPQKRQKIRSSTVSAHASKVGSPNLSPIVIKAELHPIQSINLEDPPEPDTKLYCICQTLYDGLRFMIGCENCGEWYHGDCVNISEEESLLIDKYYCSNCTAQGFQSSWIPRCKNPSCKKPARAPESKYCSSDCGLEWAKGRLRESEEKRAKLLLYLEGNNGAQNGKKSKNGGSNKSSESKRYTRNLAAERDDLAHLKRNQAEREKIKKALQINDRRYDLLEKVIARWKTSCEGLHGEPKYQPCGFDRRIVWGDIIPDDISRMCESPEDDENLCSDRRGACDKHRNWQTIKREEVSQERTLKKTLLNKINAEDKQIKMRIKQRRTDLAVALLNGTIDHTANAGVKSSNKRQLEESAKMYVDIET
ncbi:hypothetical protein G9A89_018743 [Geosiphon pyriformis]|nr:hypothetical protein G9A89_018743 [Geosiphon pyriformis]